MAEESPLLPSENSPLTLKRRIADCVSSLKLPLNHTSSLEPKSLNSQAGTEPAQETKISPKKPKFLSALTGESEFSDEYLDGKVEIQDGFCVKQFGNEFELGENIEGLDQNEAVIDDFLENSCVTVGLCGTSNEGSENQSSNDSDSVELSGSSNEGFENQSPNDSDFVELGGSSNEGSENQSLTGSEILDMSCSSNEGSENQSPNDSYIAELCGSLNEGSENQSPNGSAILELGCNSKEFSENQSSKDSEIAETETHFEKKHENFDGFLKKFEKNKDLTSSLTIEVFDETAVLDVVKVEKKKNRRRAKTFNTRKTALISVSSRNVNGKFVYSRHEMERLRYVNIRSQKKFWQEVCNGFSAIVKKEYGELGSSKLHKHGVSISDNHLFGGKKNYTNGGFSGFCSNGFNNNNHGLLGIFFLLPLIIV